jgi:hypothetical protein
MENERHPNVNQGDFGPADARGTSLSLWCTKARPHSALSTRKDEEHQI